MNLVTCLKLNETREIIRMISRVSFSFKPLFAEGQTTLPTYWIKAIIDTSVDKIITPMAIL